MYLDVNKRLIVRAIEIVKITSGHEADVKDVVENTLRAYKAAITMIIRSKMGWLTYNAPIMPKRTGTDRIIDFGSIFFKFKFLSIEPKLPHKSRL